LAEYAAVDARLIAHKPTCLSMRQAAALPLAVITAWEGLVDRARVGEGQRVLVHGGAGGVGHVAVQLAKAYGAEVFATATRNDADIIARYGATAIDFRSEDVSDYVARLTGGEGFDIVFDTVGGATLDASFIAARRFGHVVSALGWGRHDLAPLSFKGGTYSGVFTLLPLLTGIGREHHGDILRAAAALVDAGKLMPNLDPRTFSLSTVSDAHALVAGGQAAGKIVIDTMKD
jgi:NADPH:quinone reductase-like Zn-dependent oxidoreductase